MATKVQSITRASGKKKKKDELVLTVNLWRLGESREMHAEFVIDKTLMETWESSEPIGETELDIAEFLVEAAAVCKDSRLSGVPFRR